MRNNIKLKIVTKLWNLPKKIGIVITKWKKKATWEYSKSNLERGETHRWFYFKFKSKSIIASGLKVNLHFKLFSRMPGNGRAEAN